MNYEKKYKEALERAKKLYKDAITLQLEQDIKDYEYIFPELQESEDERIREAIIAYIKKADGEPNHILPSGPYSVLAMIFWLEKQGEQKSPWSENDERIITALMEGFRYHQLFNPRFGEVPNTEIISWIKSLKERLS